MTKIISKEYIYWFIFQYFQMSRHLFLKWVLFDWLWCNDITRSGLGISIIKNLVQQTLTERYQIKFVYLTSEPKCSGRYLRCFYNSARFDQILWKCENLKVICTLHAVNYYTVDLNDYDITGRRQKVTAVTEFSFRAFLFGRMITYNKFTIGKCYIL